MKFGELLDKGASGLPDSCFWDPFEKIASELNFRRNVKCDIKYTNKDFIKIIFKKDWALVIWNNGRYSIYSINSKSENAYMGVDNCSAEKILKFMEKHGIRKKAKQCDYKDAELYVVDFDDK